MAQRRDTSSGSDILLYILAVFVPPLALALRMSSPEISGCDIIINVSAMAPGRELKRIARVDNHGLTLTIFLSFLLPSGTHGLSQQVLLWILGWIPAVWVHGRRCMRPLFATIKLTKTIRTQHSRLVETRKGRARSQPYCRLYHSARPRSVLSQHTATNALGERPAYILEYPHSYIVDIALGCAGTPARSCCVNSRSCCMNSLLEKQ